MKDVFTLSTEMPFLDINEKYASGKQGESVKDFPIYINAPVAANANIPTLIIKAKYSGEKILDMPNQAKETCKKLSCPLALKISMLYVLGHFLSFTIITDQ